MQRPPSSAHPPRFVPAPLRGDETHITTSQAESSALSPLLRVSDVVRWLLACPSGPCPSGPCPSSPCPCAQARSSRRRLHAAGRGAMPTPELAALQLGTRGEQAEFGKC